MNKGFFTQLLSLLLAAVTLVSYAPHGIAQSAGTFAPTGDMTIARQFHTATLLANGKVLIVGGAAVSLRGNLQPLMTTDCTNRLPNSL
jgi:hypothetical protein